MLRVGEETYHKFRDRWLAGDRSEMPGLVRASIGFYNTVEEIDALVEWLQRIRRGDYRGISAIEPRWRSYVPRGWDEAWVAEALEL